MRRLALFLGGDVYSAAITLSTFMGGLALGSFLASRYVDRLRQALLCYGLLEIGIGLYALFFPVFLDAFSSQYQHIYRAYFDSAPWLYHAFRLLVATVTLIIPTTMMGATLPLIVKHLCRAGQIGRYSGFFYSMNTCGALAGVLGVGFVLLPTLGMKTSTFVACSLNVIIGVTALALGRPYFTGVPAEPVDAFRGATASASPGPAYDRIVARIALIAIALSGFAALALEVVWMRILIQSFSATVYAFSIMLSCFLFGIFYGSKWISSRVDRHESLPRLFGLLELGLGFCVALLAILVYFVPALFSGLLFHSIVSEATFGFGYIAAQFIISAALIIVPTLLMGATFPVAVRICTPSLTVVGRGVATVYAANTVGGVLGALVGGMVLIPAVGTHRSLLVIAAIFAGTGVLLLFRQSGPADWASLKEPSTAGLLLLFLLSAVVGLVMPQQTLHNFSSGRWFHPKVIYHGEGVSHNVDIYRSGNVTTMSVNGAGEADTSYPARRQFILKAHLPLLLNPDPKDVAVVGLGLGITLSATNRNPKVQNVEVIELTREMVKAQHYVEDISGGVLRSPKVHLRIDDGRNFMAMSDRSFDMITADPVHPRNTGVGYLYTQEYYQAIKHRLRPQGVVCQWMPVYAMSKKSFDVAFRTFVSVFPHASFWYVEGHGLFVATVEPFQIDFGDLVARMQDPVVRGDLDSIGIHTPPELLALMLMGPDEITGYLASTPSRGLNTDDNAYLEYHTPFELLQSTPKIMTGLLSFAGLDLRDVRNISPEERDEVSQAWERQRIQLLQELKALRIATQLPKSTRSSETE